MNNDDYKYFITHKLIYGDELNINTFIIENEKSINNYYNNKLFKIRFKKIEIGILFMEELAQLLNNYIFKQFQACRRRDVSQIINFDNRLYKKNIIKNGLVSISNDMKYIKLSLLMDNVIFITCYDLQHEMTPKRLKIINNIKIIESFFKYKPYAYHNNKNKILQYKDILLNEKYNLILKNKVVPENLINIIHDDICKRSADLTIAHITCIQCNLPPKGSICLKYTNGSHCECIFINNK